jgi:hypothetical protein
MKKKTTAIPTLTYSSDTWTLTERQGQKTETAEMKFLRNVAGYTVEDRIRSTVIRNILNTFRVFYLLGYNTAQSVEINRRLGRTCRLNEWTTPSKIFKFLTKF